MHNQQFELTVKMYLQISCVSNLIVAIAIYEKEKTEHI